MMTVLERPILYFLCILATASHWHYGSVVVQQLCKHFGRICFKVTKVEPVSQVDAAKATGSMSNKEHDH